MLLNLSSLGWSSLAFGLPGISSLLWLPKNPRNASRIPLLVEWSVSVLSSECKLFIQHSFSSTSHGPCHVQFSRWVNSDSLRPHGLQHARPPCPSPTPGGYSNSCPLSQWCHPTISSSLFPFSSCLQPFPASGSFPMSEFFASGGQTIAVSASLSVLPMNIQDWFPLGWTGWISLQSKVLSRVFSNTAVQSISSSVPWYIYHIMSQNGKKQVLKFVLPLNWENQRTGLPYGLRNPWPLRNYLMWFMCPVQHNIWNIFQVTNQLLSMILALETNEWAK